MTGRNAGTALKRRGLLAGAAALVAGGLARLGGAERVEAGHTSQNNPEPLHIGVINDGTSTSDTVVQSAITAQTTLVAATPAGRATLRVQQLTALPTGGGSNRALDVYGAATAATGFTAGQGLLVSGGIRTGGTGKGGLGITASGGSMFTGATGAGGDAIDARGGTGVNDPGGIGVIADGGDGSSGGLGVSATGGDAAPGGAAGAGVSGTGGTGPSGTSGGVGVVGRGGPTTGSTALTGVGVYGESARGTGVRGDSGEGNGVFGVSTNASGVYGFSGVSYGVAGVSNSFTGVYARSGSHWGLHAESGASFAAVFSGPIFVNGSYTATGAKSAAVKNRRGEHRRMYCQESTEAWFEDFGEATLEGGRAVVQLDPEFDEIVRGDDYQVFLTEYGAGQGLYVADRRPHRFEVRSNAGTATSGAFGYRVVARRLDDVGRRLERVVVPDFSKVKPLPPPPERPKVPDAPKRPDRPDAQGRERPEASGR